TAIRCETGRTQAPLICARTAPDADRARDYRCRSVARRGVPVDDTTPTVSPVSLLFMAPPPLPEAPEPAEPAEPDGDAGGTARRGRRRRGRGGSDGEDGSQQDQSSQAQPQRQTQSQRQTQRRQAEPITEPQRIKGST